MIELNKSGDDKLDVTEKDDMDGLLKALAKQVRIRHMDLNMTAGMSLPDNFNEECQRLKLKAMASIIERKKRILMPERSSAAACSSGPTTTPVPSQIQDDMSVSGSETEPAQAASLPAVSATPESDSEDEPT